MDADDVARLARHEQRMWSHQGASAAPVLLLFDFADHPGDVTAASTWLLEYVEQRVHHDTSWFPRDLVPVTDRLAVVRARRQPGRR